MPNYVNIILGYYCNASINAEIADKIVRRGKHIEKSKKTLKEKHIYMDTLRCHYDDYDCFGDAAG